MTIQDKFYCAAIIDNKDYKFSPSGSYFAPKEGDYASYMEFRRSLQLIARLEVFGMHDKCRHQ